MTIRDMEERCGLSRSNIRYYEKEGLLTPVRLPNGYREYSQREQETLEKICLLRWLGVSLEEIRALQRDEEELCVLLDRRLRALKDRQAGERARMVCRKLREDGVSYAALEAAPYLELLEKEDVPAPIPWEQPGREPPCPWRRWLARTLDVSLYMVLVMLVYLWGFRENPALLSLRSWLILFALSLLLMLLVEPIALVRWRTTPGKRLLGIYVEGNYGGRLRWHIAMLRTLQVLWQGMAFCLPVFSQIALIKFGLDHKKGKPLPWEEDSRLYALPVKRRYGWGYGAVAAALAAVSVLSGALVQLPPEMGRVTEQEFVRNFNYFSEFYGYTAMIGYTSKEELGIVYRLAQVNLLGDVVSEELEQLSWTYPEMEAYDDGKGPIRRLCSTAEGDWEWYGSDTETLQLFLLAAAAPRAGLDPAGRRAALDYIAAHPFESYTASWAGLRIEQRIEYSGYREENGRLVAVEGEEPWLRAEFWITEE